MAERQSDPDPTAPEAPPGDRARKVEALFRDHNDRLVRFLRARLGNDADAREAAQEAYVRLLQLDQANQPSFLQSYLFRVATNVATDMLRRRATGRVAIRPAILRSEAEAPSQEGDLVAREQLQAAELALNLLPARCREAFVLSRQEGWSTTRIANRLSVSDRMVRNYLTQALEQVERALDLAQAGDATR